MAALKPPEQVVHRPPRGFRFCGRCGYLTRTSVTDRAGRAPTAPTAAHRWNASCER